MKNKIQLGLIGRYWWMLLVSGLIGLGLGIWCLCSPMTSLPVLAVIFSVCLIIAGVVELCFSASVSRFNSHWGWSLVIGILDIICGVWLLCLPEPALTVSFMIIIGIWLMCVAIDAICESLILSSYSPAGIFLMVLLLLATIVMMIVFLSSPLMAATTVWLLLGFSLACFGLYRIILSFQVRKVDRFFEG